MTVDYAGAHGHTPIVVEGRTSVCCRRAELSVGLSTLDPVKEWTSREWAWQRLRLLRSSPPGLAGSSRPRARTMAAALEQAEELSRATVDVGPAARPLLLFYALSQAGRAIAAVRVREGWETSSHGLRWQGPTGDGSILDRRIEPDQRGRGLFGCVAVAVGSEQLLDGVELGAAWSALPELGVPALPVFRAHWRSPLYVYPTSDEQEAEWLRGPHLTLLVDGLRDLSGPQSVIDELAHYPSGEGGTPQSLATDEGPKLVLEYTPRAFGGLAPRVTWHAADATVAARTTRLEEIAPLYQGTPNRALIPRLSDGAWLRPISLWWLVLFGLSNLARYEPDTWVRALNVNEDKLAVPLEGAMEEALDSIPHLVLEALLGQPLEPRSYPSELP